jgi:peptidoglycan/LPS O-acetylase OafA/YrhL
MFEPLFNWLSGLNDGMLFFVLIAIVIIAIFFCWMVATIFDSLFTAWGKRAKNNKKEES